MKGTLAQLEISQGSMKLSSSQLNQISAPEIAASLTYNPVNRLCGGRTVQPHQPCLLPPSGPEPTSYQFKSIFDPSKSLNPMSRVLQTIEIILYFSCETPGQDTTDCAKVNIKCRFRWPC